jgi:hypothetical protein
MLRIPLDKICIIVAMAREALGKDAPDRMPPDRGDDDDERLDGNGSFDPLFDYVDALNGDELADLLALVWLGRGDFAEEDWDEAQVTAEEEVSDADAVAEIIQDPLLPADVAAGLEVLGYQCPEV